MPIPELDANGLLPAGQWDCTLTEAEAAFCLNPHRRALWEGLQRFIEAEVKPLGSLTLWLDGSFTRSKAHPEDIDVVIDLSTWEPALALAEAISLRLRHDAMKVQYHVDAWARHPFLPQDLAAFFQYAGDKCAAELRIDKFQAKGILRVQV